MADEPQTRNLPLHQSSRLRIHQMNTLDHPYYFLNHPRIMINSRLIMSYSESEIEYIECEILLFTILHTRDSPSTHLRYIESSNRCDKHLDLSHERESIKKQFELVPHVYHRFCTHTANNINMSNEDEETIAKCMKQGDLHGMQNKIRSYFNGELTLRTAPQWTTDPFKLRDTIYARYGIDMSCILWPKQPPKKQ